MTFWPSFPIARNDKGNWVEVGDMLNLRSAPRTEFQCGSCRDSQIGWRLIFAQLTPINLHSTGLAGNWCGCAGVGMELGSGWGVVGMGGCHGWAWNVFQFPLFSDMLRHFRLFSMILECFQWLSDCFSAGVLHFLIFPAVCRYFVDMFPILHVMSLYFSWFSYMFSLVSQFFLQFGALSADNRFP